MDDDTRKPWDIWRKAYSLLNFSKIHGFPNQCYDRGKVHNILLEFNGNVGVSAIHHIASLCKLMANFNVHHEDDIMVVFAITLEMDAMIWFYGLLDESIDSVAKIFERFLLHWHDGIVDEIEQLAKKYDALIPRVHLELEEEIHEEQTMEDLVDEAVQEPLVEDITEEIPDMAEIEDVKLPQVHVQFHDEKLELPQVPEQLHAEDVDLSQVHHIEGNDVVSADQLEQFDDEGLYVSPINQWIEVSYAQFDSTWYNFFLPNILMLQFSLFHEQIARHRYLMMNVFLFLSLTKFRKRKFGIVKMLEWLHWLYAYT